MTKRQTIVIRIYKYRNLEVSTISQKLQYLIIMFVAQSRVYEVMMNNEEWRWKFNTIHTIAPAGSSLRRSNASGVT